MNNFHLKFKEVRENLKLSQIQFAKALNISRSGVAQIEAGKTNPSFDLIFKIVKIYGINPEVFFNDDNDNINVENNAPLIAPIYAQLSKNDLKILSEVFYFPSIDEILPYLSNSEARNKAILKDSKQELKEKLTTYNSIMEIAKMLKISDLLDKYDDFIDIEKYIKGVIKECKPDDYKEGFMFDSFQLSVIVQILAFEESIEHISFLTDKKVKYLRKDCLYLIESNYIKF